MTFFKYLLIIEVLLVGTITTWAQHHLALSKDIEVITHGLVENHLSESINPAQLEEISRSIKADGSWPGIDYNSVTDQFPAEKHLMNLNMMTLGYSKKGSVFFRNKELKEKIISGYEFYYNKKPKSLNWWYNEIGGPQAYMVGLVLLKDELTPTQLLHYAAYLKDLTDNTAHRGMNRIWVSAIAIYKGCLENDPKMVDKGFRSVASTLVIADEQGVEGIKIDNSFHQHRPQLYSGGYGMGFADATAALMALSANTSFYSAFTAEKIKLFSDLLLDGHQLFGYRNAVDFGTIGRNISRPNAIQNIKAVTLEKMMVIDPKQASQFQDWKKHLNGEVFSKTHQGNKYFWKSDIMTQHGAAYYLSAKVISTRTNGTEMLNGENLKGYNLPLGATNIMITGSEYKNIFPVWDWTRIPGTTAVMNQSAAILPWYQFGSNEFGGGVSEGKAGIIAYKHSYNGVQANKAYFFIDGAMLCLGAGINAMRTQQIVTSVNQCFLQGDVFVGTTTDLAGIKTLDSSRVGRDLQWVYHDGVGYQFPEGGTVTLNTLTQTGSWKSINVMESDAVIKKKVFSLWINHGTAPNEDQYCYIVRPEGSFERFKKKISSPDFVVIRNDKKIQLVKNREQYFIVFYQPGEADLGNGLKIKADVEAIMMLTQTDKGFKLVVADPTHQHLDVNISINQKLKGEAVTYPESNTTRINFKYPQGDNKGSAVSGYYQK